MGVLEEIRDSILSNTGIEKQPTKLAVDPELWLRAFEEMREHQAETGDIPLARPMDEANFLFMGIPIVMNKAA